MKKVFVLTFALCAAFAFTSCKSSLDAYKSGYNEAELAKNNQAEIAPVESATTDVDPNVDTTYRTEKVVLSSGEAGSLRAFSVVCGSYSRVDGAEAVRKVLVDEGYEAIVVQSPETGLYRVICASFDTKEEAAMARDKFKADHPKSNDFQKAWLLYNK